MDRKKQVKGWILLGLVPLILLYIGSLYRIGGFSPVFTMTLLAAVPGVGLLALSGFRMAGSIPAWAAMAAGLLTALFGCEERGTAMLVWALCCGGPLAVSIVWPSRQKIRPLAMDALPVAGAVWLGGSLLYARWHFGTWQLSAVTRRIGESYLLLIDQMEQIYKELYPQGFPQELEQMLALIREQDQAVGFLMISLVAYLLFGSFFGCIWAADRIASQSKKERWLGSWSALIPSRGLSWAFFIAYFIAPFLGEEVQLPAMTVLNLLGFFYVFTALYTLLQLLREKGWRPVFQGLLVGGLFVLSFFSVNGSALAPYSLLLIAGLVVATTPAVVQKILK